MCWVMLFTFPLMAAIQEISGRIGRVTGQGIAGNIRQHYSKTLLARDRVAAAGRETSSTWVPIWVPWGMR